MKNKQTKTPKGEKRQCKHDWQLLDSGNIIDGYGIALPILHVIIACKKCAKTLRKII